MQALKTTGATIVLLGIKHSGKSTLGDRLAGLLGRPFFDTDDIITEQTGKTPREVLRGGGKAALLAAERDAAAWAAAQGSAVIATGGGICENDAALAALQGSRFVYLDVAEDVAANRILRKSTILLETPPRFTALPAYLAGRHEELSAEEVRRRFHPIYETRTARYRAFAEALFAPDEAADPQQNAAALLRFLQKSGMLAP
jgi:shikimate kinase